MAKLITMLRIETGQGPSIRYTEDRTMDSPLTSKGCDQVKLVGARIVRDGDKFDLAVSSWPCEGCGHWPRHHRSIYAIRPQEIPAPDSLIV